MVNARAAHCAEALAFMTSGPTLRSLADGATAFLGWWRDELAGIVPEQAYQLVARNQPEVVLAQVDGGYVVVNGAARGPGEALPRAEAIARLAGASKSKEGGGTPTGKLRVRQLIVKRDAIDPLIIEVKAAGLDVAFVDCWEDQPGVGL